MIAEAVCLGWIAPQHIVGTGFRVYLKRLSFNASTPLWHGFDPEDPVPEEEVYRSVHLYHRDNRPHEKADLVVGSPEDGHTLRGPVLK